VSAPASLTAGGQIAATVQLEAEAAEAPAPDASPPVPDAVANPHSKTSSSDPANSSHGPRSGEGATVQFHRGRAVDRPERRTSIFPAPRSQTNIKGSASASTSCTLFETIMESKILRMPSPNTPPPRQSPGVP
jgi:hypothetical protein